MIGAIFGDIVGSIYEFENIKTTAFDLFNPSAYFTDDTVLSAALAESIMHGIDFIENCKKFVRYYPSAGYGANFRHWASSSSRVPYNSWGNGAAMRVSPVGFAYTSIEEVLEKAEASASITHNHPEGIKGAQATASAIFLARTGQSKENIQNFIETRFSYDLSRSLDEIRPTYSFDVSCQGTVPEAIIAFLESTNYLHAIQLAISLGGDSDTLACITGGIAQAFYGIPEQVSTYVFMKLDSRLLHITRTFCTKFRC
jgi:ADP-ribosylglycohydrolase